MMRTVIDMTSIRHTRRAVRPLVAALAPALVGFALASCSSDLSDAAPDPTTASTAPAAPTTVAPTTTVAVTAAQADIVGTALTAGAFTELAGLVADAGLIETLRGGPFTVFAPTDAAFAKLPASALHDVQDDPELLATVLTYHVVAGTLHAADLVDGKLDTVAGVPLTISHAADGTVLVDGHPITAADIDASNGVIHVMSDVLLPAG